VRSADTEEPAMTPPEPPVSLHTLVLTPWSNMQPSLDFCFSPCSCRTKNRLRSAASLCQMPFLPCCQKIKCLAGSFWCLRAPFRVMLFATSSLNAVLLCICAHCMSVLMSRLTLRLCVDAAVASGRGGSQGHQV